MDLNAVGATFNKQPILPTGAGAVTPPIYHQPKKFIKYMPVLRKNRPKKATAENLESKPRNQKPQRPWYLVSPSEWKKIGHISSYIIICLVDHHACVWTENQRRRNPVLGLHLRFEEMLLRVPAPLLQLLLLL